MANENEVSEVNGQAPDSAQPASINNSNITFKNRVLCIRLNDKDPKLAELRSPDATEARRNKLKASYANLARKYKSIRNIESSNPLQTILDRVFVNGLLTEAYVRNLTFTSNNGRTVPVIAIRPKTHPMDYIHQILPEGVSLIFKGHIRTTTFVVDSIYDIADTEKLDFEVESSFIPRDSLRVFETNFLKEVISSAASLTEYTRQRLEVWQDYLKWKKEISKRQIFGVKYYKLTCNAKKKRIVVHLVCADKEAFQKIKKYLARDMQLFNNSYSSNPWEFSFNDDSRTRGFEPPKELGRYRGIVAEYYYESSSGNNSADASEQTADDEQEYEYEFDYDEDYVEESNTSAVLKSSREITENDLAEHFTKPYIVEVEYELSRNVLEGLAEKSFASAEEERNYIIGEIMPSYYKNGFLAQSAVGDFVLIRRFERAIKSFESDECWSPNLAVWLFDITKARLPVSDKHTEITQWHNQDIAKNENQRTAVQKMLDAPDICLIQGPPGTGKTTVIAEAIYQLAKQGLRILVASQSNDAVDNALERLADSPLIRAIRVSGQQVVKRKNEEAPLQKFSEKEALKYYYSSVSSGISERWLDRWNSLEAQLTECQSDRRDAMNFRQDIVEYDSLLTQAADNENRCRRELQSSREAMDAALRENDNLNNQQQQFALFSERVEGISKKVFYLSDEALLIAEQELSDIITQAAGKGVYLTPGYGMPLNHETQDNLAENTFLGVLISRAGVLCSIADKLTGKNADEAHTAGGYTALDEMGKQLQEQLVNAVMNNDNAELERLRREMQRIQDEKTKQSLGQGGIVLDSEEKIAVSEELYKRISEGNYDGLENQLRELIKAVKERLAAVVGRIDTMLSQKVKHDLNACSEEIRRCEAKYNAAQTEAARYRNDLESKRNTLHTLSEKYHADSDENDVVIAAIDAAIERTRAELNEQNGIRSVWEGTMVGFQKRLDGKGYRHDRHLYQDIYISSCNVVGLSCTDRKLSELNSIYDDFDVVIIDEVSKATPPEMLIPLMRAKKAILVGDHRQLPPMFKEHEQSYSELIEDRENMPEEIQELLTNDNFVRYKKMVTSSLFKEYFEQADSSIKHSLLVQYRMHSDIMSVINRFYEMRLKNGLDSATENSVKNHGITAVGVDGAEFIVPEKHAYWLDSSALPSGRPMYDSRATNSGNIGGTSVFNVYEKYLVIETLKKIADSLRKTGETKTVGVISFYQSQVNRIREAFRDARKSFDFSPIKVEINTVDRFQGKEKNIIIASLVRNNRSARAGEHIVAFERINVAFSRAQEMLMIVGAKHMYEAQNVQLPNMDTDGYISTQVYRQIIEELNRNGALKFGTALVTSELENAIIKEYEGKDD